MAWDEEARHHVFKLYGEGQTEMVIVREVCEARGSDDKTVRRCIAALDIITSVGYGEEVPAHLQSRFDDLNGTEHYLRELRRAYEAQWPTAMADPELGPHGRELFHFGQRLRDRLNPDFSSPKDHGDSRLLWVGRPTSYWEDPGPHRHQEEAMVEDKWPFMRYNAREHAVFPAFAEHLKGNQCWVHLAGLDEAVKNESETPASELVNAFRQCLYPDSRLRKLVILGRCDQCP